MTKKKVLSLALSFLMVLCLIPAGAMTAFADGGMDIMEDLGTLEFNFVSDTEPSKHYVLKNPDDPEKRQALKNTLTLLENEDKVRICEYENPEIRDYDLDMDGDWSYDICVITDNHDYYDSDNVYHPAYTTVYGLQSSNLLGRTITVTVPDDADTDGTVGQVYYKTLKFTFMEKHNGDLGAYTLDLTSGSKTISDKTRRLNKALVELAYNSGGELYADHIDEHVPFYWGYGEKSDGSTDYNVMLFDLDWDSTDDVKRVYLGDGRYTYSKLSTCSLKKNVTFELDANEKEYLNCEEDYYYGKVTFKLFPVLTEATVSGIKNKAYTGKAVTQTPVVKVGSKTLKNGTDYTVKYTNNTNIGTATMTITGKAGKCVGTQKKTFKIVPAKMAAPTVTNAAKGFKITWKKAAGGVTGYEIWRSKAGGTYQKVKTIASAGTTTFTDSTAAANANGVKYAYKIRAYKKGQSYGAFSAAKVSYKVAKPAAPTVTNSGVGKITVKWTKNAKASGYKIKYVTGTTTKTVTVTGAATVKKALTVKQGAAYKVYVQAYKTVSGKTYHSCFSPAKSITTNKFIKYKTTGKVNYRTAPGLNTTVKGSIPQGTTVQAVSSYSKVVNNVTWKKIFYKNAFYYVASGYLKKV